MRNDENNFDQHVQNSVSGDVVSPSVIRPQPNNLNQNNFNGNMPDVGSVPVGSLQDTFVSSNVTNVTADDASNNYKPEAGSAPIVGTQANPQVTTSTHDNMTGPQSMPVSGMVANPQGVISSNPAPVPSFSPQNSNDDGYTAPVITPGKKKRGLKVLMIAIAAIVLLCGAGAGAYFGYVLPNKPENKLGLSLLNSFKNQQGTVSGKIDFKSKTGDSMAVAVDYKLQNTAEGSMSLSGNLGVQGTSFPFESIYADKDIYVKVGGLNAIASFLPSAETSGLDFSKLSDTWFVINRSLLQSSDQASCAIDINTSLSKDDQSKLKTAYNSHPLFLIESSSSEKLEGQPVMKMVVKPTSDDEADKFFKELENMDMYKSIKECLGGSTDTVKNTLDKEVKPDYTKDMKTTMTAYIGKGNQLKKVEIKASDDEMSLDMEMSFDWSPVTITKPEGAKPIQDILSSLDLSNPNTEADSEL